MTNTAAGATQVGRNPRHVHSTEGVCLWQHNQYSLSLQHSSQSSSQRVGALSLIPSCLGISGHPSESRQGHPRYTGARSAGRPWVVHEIRLHSTQCRNTPNTSSCSRRFQSKFCLRCVGSACLTSQEVMEPVNMRKSGRE